MSNSCKGAGKSFRIYRTFMIKVVCTQYILVYNCQNICAIRGVSVANAEQDGISDNKETDHPADILRLDIQSYERNGTIT